MPKSETVRAWLERLAGTNESTDGDAERMTFLLRRIGFAEAVVTYGIVYTEGRGTPESPPMDIHAMAAGLVKVAQKEA